MQPNPRTSCQAQLPADPRISFSPSSCTCRHSSSQAVLRNQDNMHIHCCVHSALPQVNRTTRSHTKCVDALRAQPANLPTEWIAGFLCILQIQICGLTRQICVSAGIPHIPANVCEIYISVFPEMLVPQTVGNNSTMPTPEAIKDLQSMRK